MREFDFSLTPPDGWDDVGRDGGAVFGTRDWQAILESSFNCRTIYARDGVEGAAITAFKAGPFSVGYVGFPAGAVAGDPEMLESLFSRLAKDKPLSGLACVRVPFSAFESSVQLDATPVNNPETAIPDLGNWDLMSVSKNLRRDIRKAERSGLAIERTTDPSIGPTLFGMYESAVRHHGGSLRYNAAYFRGLLELAGSNERIRIYTARHDSEVAGFAVIIQHRTTAYYLHGGSSSALRQLSPSDLILAGAIDDAFARGGEGGGGARGSARGRAGGGETHRAR